MVSTHKISGSAAAGFAEYLTADGSRGDYYAGGDLDDRAGRWHGSPQALGTLGLEPGGGVERDALVASMRGRSPVSGEPVRPVGGDGSRVAGIDLTFSAPKSVSALWAVSSPDRRAQIEVAHRRAVASALSRIEREVELVRRRERGQGRVRWERARSLVAGEFVHTASRLTRDQERDGVPDPQLHSHVLVVAAERLDGRFAALDSRELFRSGRVSGAWYRAELAFELGELGLEVESGTGAGARYFEVAGVPRELVVRWSRRSEVIERAARRFRERYGRAPRAGELGSLTVATRGTKTVTAEVDVRGAWRAVGEEYGLTQGFAERLFGERPRHQGHDLEGELLADLPREQSMVSGRELDARAFELAAGAMRPARAREHIAALARSGELVELEQGCWTTRELRELEARTVATALARGREPARPVSIDAVERAVARRERFGRLLSAEQREAVTRVTGAGGVAVLVGEAGTGKGVVIATAREAWEYDGRQVVGVAVAGATAKRLQADTGIKESMTIDALVRRHQRGELELDERSVLVADEAAMVDTARLGRLVQLAAATDSKLVLVGDSAQLSPIGAGGLFAELEDRVPTARLAEVHRARQEWERDAWAHVRAGRAPEALAAYQANGRLHISDTREDASERMVDHWDRARLGYRGDRVVMFTDASNHELDRINKAAQARREQAGELGQRRVPLPARPYQLAAGDEVLLTGQLRPPGQQRVENGTRGEVLAVDPATHSVVLRTRESPPREVTFNTDEFSEVRLAYAQHVFKAQGATVDRALVLTGGWQSDRERAYVAVTRARERTDLYVAREDLGEEGIDQDLVARLAERLNLSRAQQASLTREQVGGERESGFAAELARIEQEQRQQREAERERGGGFDVGF